MNRFPFKVDDDSSEVVPETGLKQKNERGTEVTSTKNGKGFLQFT